MNTVNDNGINASFSNRMKCTIERQGKVDNKKTILYKRNVRNHKKTKEQSFTINTHILYECLNS